jgi:hypothetical protein
VMTDQARNVGIVLNCENKLLHASIVAGRSFY